MPAGGSIGLIMENSPEAITVLNQGRELLQQVVCRDLARDLK